jgi:hypothetical protein
MYPWNDTSPEIAQLILDAIRALLSGSPDGLEQARVKVGQAQALLDAGVSE